MDETSIKYILEAALLASSEPLSVEQMMSLFDESSRPERKDIRAALDELEADYEDRGIMLAEVASGFRVQVRRSMSAMLQPLWEERPPRYSRALFETLALIAYRQPITRGEIEDVRGVTVSPNIIRTLLDREWIRVLGHRDVPGKPEMFGTTKAFLDYFGLKRLDDLPPLAELQDIEGLNAQLEFATGEESEAVPANVTALRAGDGEDSAEAAAGSDEAEHAAADAHDAHDAEDGESAYEDTDESADADEVAEAEASGESEEAGEEERASAGAPPSS
ncbi:SMC-Scp complex subunit ScpB [Lentisalinibacter orientalis]|uniref:SMC-Scp complex subunit ScpB n=1 Tax=Lentisalinibacter orientalis TaxID=2992241 RepID=UPI00386F1BBA